MTHRRWPSLDACLALAVALPLLLGPASATGADTSGGPIDLHNATPASQAARHSSAIALTAGGDTLLVVNPDSNSLTLVDTATRSPLAELPVGADPRTVAVDEGSGRAYVANRGSASVSVVDLAARQVITHVTVGQRPYGVVVSPDGTRLYVAEQGSDRIAVLDTARLQTIATVAVPDRPSGLAVTEDGRTLLVTHLLSNFITVLDEIEMVHMVYLPLILRGNLVDWGTGHTAPGYQGTTYQSTNLLIYRSTTIPLWPDSNLVQSIVLGSCPSSDDGSSPLECAYVPHTQSFSSNEKLTFETTVRPQVSLVDVTAREHLVGQHFDLGTLDLPGVGLPFDAALTPDGRELWVVNAASNDLTVVDLHARQLAAHIEVGDNPRGIVLSPDGAASYVNNSLAGTVSVIDAAAYTVTDIITVTDIPLPPVLLNGKRLFHTSDDPRMARAQWISCNTCHFEGGHDGRTWVFGFAGPRNTTGLLGMVETYPLRWSGEWDESADSEFANRKENFGSGLIEGEMNCALSPPDCVNRPPNQGRSYDLDCLAAFIDSLQVELSPSHAHGEPLSPAEDRGQELFNDPAIGCATCHPAPLYTDLQMHDVGTATEDERIGPAYDTPTLRGLYDSAPYFHDGSAATLYDTITRPSPGGEHDVRSLLSEDEMDDLIAFLKALPFDR
jgi:YVTN family beta-propeller protein